MLNTSRTILGILRAAPGVRADRVHPASWGPEGEIAVGNVAKRLGIPHALSTMGTRPSITSRTPSATRNRWFQLYDWRDRGASQALSSARRRRGSTALLLTVHTDVSG